MMFFLPDCDDFVDPYYDFHKDKSGSLGSSLFFSVFSHEIYRKNNFDGILLSRKYLFTSKEKEDVLENFGVHGYMRLSKDTFIFGDSGAFSYIDEREPTYTVDELVNYYSKYKFDMGASLDHIIRRNNDVEEDKFRYQITRQNLKNFIDLHHKLNCDWIPVGSIQGYDIDSYVKMAQFAAEIGYDYIAIGGIAKEKADFIVELVKRIRLVLNNIKIHLFGIGRIELYETFMKLNVTSIDSTSFYRKSWLDSTRNYYYKGEWYAALRVPFSKDDSLSQQEQNILNTIQNGAYDAEELARVLERYFYENQCKKTQQKNTILSSYIKTLSVKPWTKCNCCICKNMKEQVILLRGKNRNYRRGFHNQYQFFEQFKKLRSKYGSSLFDINSSK